MMTFIKKKPIAKSTANKFRLSSGRNPRNTPNADIKEHATAINNKSAKKLTEDSPFMIGFTTSNPIRLGKNASNSQHIVTPEFSGPFGVGLSSLIAFCSF